MRTVIELNQKQTDSFRLAINRICLDSFQAFFSITSVSANDRKDSERRFQYRQIGWALLLCEEQYLQVGIPWVWMPKRVAPRYCFSPHVLLEDFIKIQLVGVKTKVLYSYDRDLCELSITNESFRSLHLHDYKSVIRYASVIVAPILCLLVAMSILMAIFHEFLAACIVALLLSICAGMHVARLCSERQRRLSFSRVIRIELMRRTGRGQDMKSPVPIFSAEEPVG